VPPGTYTATLTVGDWSMSQDFELVKDPRVTTSDDDLVEQYELMSAIRDKLSETATAANSVRKIRKRVDDWKTRLADDDDAADILAGADALMERLTAIENELVQVEFTAAGDSLNYREMLFEKLGNLAPIVSSADARPTTQSHAVFAKLAGQIDEQLAALRTVLDDDLAALNAQLNDHGVHTIAP
ncbi:MAG: glycosyl hydrolase, partial [Ilumatobacteraceae bacterium]